MPIDFSRKLLDLWGGTLEEKSLGLSNELEKETEVTIPSAFHVGETTAVIVDDAMSNMDTTPLANGTAKKQGECRSDVIGESTVDVGKEIG
jgi:hypothetical protein